jgi:hypothetical protein
MSQTSGVVSEYMCHVPCFLRLTKPAFLSIFRWRETTGWSSFKWGVISQTHFSLSRKKSIISSLIGSESALKILALKRVRLFGFEGIIKSSSYKYLNIVIYIHQLKQQKAEIEKCVKKHIMVFLEARYRGVQQSTMKNASTAENAQITARSACTNSKRKKETRGQS